MSYESRKFAGEKRRRRKEQYFSFRSINPDEGGTDNKKIVKDDEENWKKINKYPKNITERMYKLAPPWDFQKAKKSNKGKNKEGTRKITSEGTIPPKINTVKDYVLT